MKQKKNLLPVFKESVAGAILNYLLVNILYTTICAYAPLPQYTLTQLVWDLNRPLLVLIPVKLSRHFGVQLVTGRNSR